MPNPLLRLTPKQRKLARWVAIAIASYALIGFFILPPVVRIVAAKRLSSELDREVSIQKVKLNPFVLSATIRGLLIKDKDGEPFVSWDEVYVNFQLSSFLGHSWVFKEVSTTRPFVRVRMNKDYTLNFSDLIAKFSSNAPPKTSSKPLALRIDRLAIRGAEALLTDLTPRTPFERRLGPLDVTLEHFRTDPDNRNPYSFSGTTDAGERFSWSGYFYLDPLRSHGEFSLENLALNKYEALYQDLVRFKIRDGVVDVRSSYQIEISSSNRVASATNASFVLRSFKLNDPGTGSNIVELPEFSVTGASADATGRRADVDSVAVNGARLVLRRDKESAINVVELAKPAETATNAPGGILMLLRSVTNAVALLLNTTNAWTGTIRGVTVRDCELQVEDLANPRPVRLSVDNISLDATNISNLPGTNLTASLSLRWNTNGSIRTDLSASLLPPTADILLNLKDLELRPLDPYLESRLNVFILGSKLGMDGRIRLRTDSQQLPQVTFDGNARLDDFSTIDGVAGDDLLKWHSVQLSKIGANLNPPSVAIDQISIDDPYARLIIESNHVINLLAALRIAQTNSTEATPAPAGKGKKRVRSADAAPVPAPVPSNQEAMPKITVAKVVISSGQVQFTDRSVTPNVNLAVAQAYGTVSDLSSEQSRHAVVNLQAKVDNVGPVEIAGTINPFSERQTNDIKITVKDVDLTPTSPYAGKFAGYGIAKGKLNMALAYHLQGRSLKAENVITVDQFSFGEKVESPDATKLPVRLAVAILKDRNGRIQLDVPVEGSLDDPEFRLHKVIVHAFVNFITRIVTSPFAALSSLFGGKGEEIRYQDFAPGSSILLTNGAAKLDSLAKGFYERPGLQLEIEGSVDPEADRAALRRAAFEKELRMAKWQSLRKSAREATSPERITIAPDERDVLIKQLYNDALAKGRIMPSGQGGSGLGQGAAASKRAMAVAEQGPPSANERGATSLMQNREELPGVVAGANPGIGGAGPTGIELALVNSISIGDAEFGALATDRARAVRAYLLTAGKVEPERVFITESKTGAVKTEGARAYLQLR